MSRPNILAGFSSKIITHVLHTFAFTHSHPIWINGLGTSIQSSFGDSGLGVVDDISIKTHGSLSEVQVSMLGNSNCLDVQSI